jgi:hypothetical protein
MFRCTLLALTTTLLLPHANADEGLRQCRGIAEAAARLACYDALPLAAAAGAAPPAAPAVAAVAPVATAPAAPSPHSRFGLPPPRERAEGRDEARMETRIDGRFEGWRPRDRIRLANGQVWEVTDTSSGSYWLMNPRAVVRPGALGSFMLEIEGVRALIRVRRIE